MTLRNPESPLLCLKEAASILNCHVKTVRRLVDDGQIVAHRLRGRIVIKAEVLKRFINQLPEER